MPLSAFADDGNDVHLRRLRIGEGLVGQCAAEKRRMVITDVPPNTIAIRSGLFEATPRNVIVLPVLFEDQVKAVIELASLSTFTASQLAFLEQLTTSIGIVLNSIEATMQTEGLLKQSQQLATELQTQQKELQQTNEQLAQKAQQLAEQNVEVERKNQEIEQARGALEGKAKELALTSKYKSEFLANMSHELRTPSEQHPGSGSAAERQSGRQSHRETGRVCPHHPRSGNGPAQSDHAIFSISPRLSPAPSRWRQRRSRSPACWRRLRGPSGTRPRTAGWVLR